MTGRRPDRAERSLWISLLTPSCQNGSIPESPESLQWARAGWLRRVAVPLPLNERSEVGVLDKPARGPVGRPRDKRTLWRGKWVRLTRLLRTVLLLGAVACLAAPAVAAPPPQLTMMGLTALELLAERARIDPDLTLQPVAREAAGAVRLPRMSAADTMSVVIDRLRTAVAPGVVEGRAAIEAKAVELSGEDSETVTRFANELLALTARALRNEQDVFVDEVIIEAADAVGVAGEAAAMSLALHLIEAAARHLRPEAPASLEDLPAGVYVLAVHLASSSKQVTENYRYYQLFYDHATARRLSGMWTTVGSDVVASVLQKSMRLKRTFRRIVPCENILKARSLNADYLLLLDADLTWADVEDERGLRPDAGDILLMPPQSQVARPGGAADDGRSSQMTMDLTARITSVNSGNEVWALRDTLTRFRDELVDSTDETELFELRGGQKIEQNSLLLGILDLVASQTRIELGKLR